MSKHVIPRSKRIKISSTALKVKKTKALAGNPHITLDMAKAVTFAPKDRMGGSTTAIISIIAVHYDVEEAAHDIIF